MKVKLKDIAKITGISIGAVSKALNPDGTSKIRISDATRKKVLDVAKELNYSANIAARQLAGKSGRLIGLLVGFDAPPIELERISLFERFASEKGYHVIVSHFALNVTFGELESYLKELAARNIDGLIVIGSLFGIVEESERRDLYKKFNTVYLCSASQQSMVSKSVSIDLDDGGRQIIEHLSDRGYKRIGLATYPGRFNNFFKEMKRVDIKVDEKLCWNYPIQGIEQKLSKSNAEAIVDTLVLDKKVDALIVENDYWAARILQVFQEYNIKSPDDVAIVGYNNLEMAEFLYPPLTTIDENNDEIAYILFNILINSINNKTKEQCHFLVKPKLIVRKTT